jgi:hypothetical protein
MTTNLWAIQTKLTQEDSTLHLVEAFQKLGITWAAFPFPPFQNYIPDFEWGGPIIYYGSTRLIETVYQNRQSNIENNAEPDSEVLFYDEKGHSPTVYGVKLGKSWLNYGATLTTIGEFLEAGNEEERFIKPTVGMKSFGGKVFRFNEFKTLAEYASTNNMFDAKTEIIVQKPIGIQREVRTWIVGGKISAMVGYKVGTMIMPWSVDFYSKELHEEITKFVEIESQKLSDLGAFVLDVAVTNDGLKVVEINCIHAAGFYLSDHIIEVVRD